MRFLNETEYIYCQTFHTHREQELIQMDQIQPRAQGPSGLKDPDSGWSR